MIPMYVNVTGPGDYHIPGFTDKRTNETDSNRRTAPSFTCAPRTTQPYWPEYEVVSNQILLLSWCLINYLKYSLAGFQRSWLPWHEQIQPKVQAKHWNPRVFDSKRCALPGHRWEESGAAEEHPKPVRLNDQGVQSKRQASYLKWQMLDAQDDERGWDDAGAGLPNPVLTLHREASWGDWGAQEWQLWVDQEQAAHNTE